MHRITTALFLLAGLTAAEPFVMPEGTKVTASFACDKDKGADKLVDGNPETWMMPGGGTARSADAVTSVVITFPTPVADLGGIVTGRSDQHHNYWPKRLEFWADSDGDGRADTKLGESDKLGPWEQCKGTHAFAARLPTVHALEIRCVLQNTGGGGRAWIMDELSLLTDPTLPVAKATPNAWKVTWYSEDLPEGTTVSSPIACEDGKGVDNLIDRDQTTFMNPKGGTAKEGQPVAVFLRFPMPTAALGGVTLGKSDPYNNYTWEAMEFWADTTGNGTYDTLVGSATGGSEGRKRFNKVLPAVHGLELRVTKQTLKGTMRAFMLAEIGGLLFQDTLADREMRTVLEDFEDLSSWRTWGAEAAHPEGERLYGEHMWLCGAYRPGVGNGQGVGAYRYWLKDKGHLWATRGKIAEIPVYMDAITLRANPQGYACSLSFELIDSKGKKVYSPGVSLSGDGWKDYTIDLRPQAWPAARTLSPPLTLKMFHLHGSTAGKGEVLVDDVAAQGLIGRNHRASINPVWEGLAHDPAKPVVQKYLLRNSLDVDLTVPLQVRLYSAYDAKRLSPVWEKSLPVTIPKWGDVVVPVDFGTLPYGHYEVELHLKADGVAASQTDMLAVLTLNGGRVNRSPMWIGSQHPASWIANEENSFVFKQVVGPLGMDVYRTGAPDPRVLEMGLLCAAGFGGLPKHLQKPGAKRADIDEPNDYAAYEAWVQQEAASKYLPYKDKIVGVEYYNEPDLPDFCYIPEIDAYLKMWRSFAKGFRAGAPGVLIGTGGNTVAHGKEKKDFNRRMYTELAKETDILVWHAHGPLSNYSTRHRMVEGWAEAGGKPKAEQRHGQTEAGAVSFNSSVERLQQAATLVQKIGWAKGQANSAYYTWFTTTDTYDPQGGYLHGENWGVVTINQRLKPSGQAMNEVIRQLANSRGEGEVKLDLRLQSVTFAREDGGRTWLFWPTEQGAVFLQQLAASGPMTLVDMFGRREELQPKDGQISFRTTGWPQYLVAATGVEVKPTALPAWVSLPAIIGVSPGAQGAVAVGVKNVWGKDANLTMKISDMTGLAVAEAALAVAKEASGTAQLTIKLPKGLSAGTAGYILAIASSEVGVDVRLPLMVAVGELVPKAGNALVADGKPAKPDKTGRIVVDQSTAMHDLVADPSTPLWANAEDLSATMSLAHDGKGLSITVTVKDQTHNPGPASDKLWSQDSVQIAIGADGKQMEFGLSEAGGGFGWAWLGEASLIGKPLPIPLAAKRDGGTTTYQAYVTFAQIGLDYVPGKMIRLTFMVNEDDGRGRVRLLKWFDGIHPGKEIHKFGYIILE